MNNRIAWTGYEFEYKEKTSDWYWAVSIIVVCVSTIFFIYNNPIFGLFILLAGGSVLINARNAPRLLDYELTDKGLFIGNKLYPYLDFKTFWVSESKYSAPKLLLRTNKIVNPLIIITIETDYVDPDVVRDFLLDYIPEDKTEEPISIKIMEFFGF
jgi:hypothetical protein